MKSVFKPSFTVATLKAKLTAFAHDTALLPRRVHVAVASFALFVSTHAMASGVTGFFTGWRNAIQAGIELVILGAMLVGICFVLYGLINLGKKGMGRGDDIEWSKITWPIIGGALATVLLYVIQSVVEEGGARCGLGAV